MGVYTLGLMIKIYYISVQKYTYIKKHMNVIKGLFDLLKIIFEKILFFFAFLNVYFTKNNWSIKNIFWLTKNNHKMIIFFLIKYFFKNNFYKIFIQKILRLNSWDIF